MAECINPAFSFAVQRSYCSRVVLDDCAPGTAKKKRFADPQRALFTFELGVFTAHERRDAGHEVVRADQMAERL